MKRNYLTILVLCILFYGSYAYGGIYYVGINGSDSQGNGSSTKPWRSVSYALQNVRSGDTVSINDGVYSEGQLVVPPGVNLTSTSKNNTKVKLQPKEDLYLNRPFLLLSSPTPGSSGNQTIGHIEFSGINGTNKAQSAILVQNRNDVRIHHCNIHDFFASEEENHYAIKIESTQIKRTSAWWEFWPADSGPVGDNRSIDMNWPKNPVENFEFDNNIVKDCFAISPYNLKNSSFHHNSVDNRNTSGWCIKATSAFMYNVDIYDNTFLGGTPTEEGQTPWRVELWLNRNGCEYYNNTMDGYFSITIGKETRIYNNIIKKEPLDSTYTTGIEFNGQSYGEIFGNSISGAGIAIRVGIFNFNGKDWVSEHIKIYDNIVQNHRYHGIRVEGTSSLYTTNNVTVRNIDVYNNVVDGQNRGSTGLSMLQNDKVGTCKVSNINVKENIVTGLTGYAGATKGTVYNAIIDHNTFFGNAYNTWVGASATNTDTNAIEIETLLSAPAKLSPPTLQIIEN